VVTLKVKYADFSLVTRRVTLPDPTDDDRAIYEAARAQLARVERAQAVRLTGVSVSGFAGEEEAGQLGLFAGPAAPEPADATRRRALNAALDALTDRFGDQAVTRADLSRPRGGGG
jgi:DNA polymerase-4